MTEGGPELRHIVGRTDERPFSPHLPRGCKNNCVTGYHASSREEGGFDDQARHENGCVVG
jgi:hypothetical protein